VSAGNERNPTRETWRCSRPNERGVRGNPAYASKFLGISGNALTNWATTAFMATGINGHL